MTVINLVFFIGCMKFELLKSNQHLLNQLYLYIYIYDQTRSLKIKYRWLFDTHSCFYYCLRLIFGR